MIGRFGIAALLLLAGCTPNPRNEVAAVAEAALTQAAADAPGKRMCVARTIAQWQPAAAVRRVDPPAPPGFAPLLRDGVFRGGGALKGAGVGGVDVRDGAKCFDLRGPLVEGNRAMLEVHLAPTGWNVWLRKVDGDWRVVMTTTSVYPG